MKNAQGIDNKAFNKFKILTLLNRPLEYLADKNKRN